MRFFHILLFINIFNVLSCSQASASHYNLDYSVRLLPKEEIAEVSIEVNNTDKISLIDFNLKKSSCSNFESTSKIEQKDGRLLWKPSGKISKISYRCKITHKREKQNGMPTYDALMNNDWALFRGDDLVPPAKVRVAKGWESKAKISFELPKNWPSINTEWERDLSQQQDASQINKPIFFVDNPHRSFDRPTGWMIAGKLGTRRAKLIDDDHVFRIAVSSPLDSEFRRMDVLTFIQLIWPEFEKAFAVKPKKILIVSAGDPMWRGGLSASNSFYMHEDRPIVSENGTSTLTHEMFHMLTGIRGKKGHDWIAEGLAEYYSLNLIMRAGGMNEDRYQKSLEMLQSWSKDVKSLKGKHSKGERTAAAVLLLDKLNKEIYEATEKKSTLDDVVKKLIPKGKVSLADFKQATEEVIGKPSKTLGSKALL